MIGNQSESIKCSEKALKVTQRGQTVLLKYKIKKTNARMWSGISLLIKEELWKLPLVCIWVSQVLTSIHPSLVF